MGTAIKEGSGLYVECPGCHHPIYRGLQSCQSCGHVVTAEQQKSLQLLFLKQLSKVVGILVAVLAVTFYFLSNK